MTMPSKITLRPHRVKAADLSQDEQWSDAVSYIRADIAWNDAIEAAARVYENGVAGDSWDYFQDAYDAIRALRKDTK